MVGLLIVVSVSLKIVHVSQAISSRAPDLALSTSNPRLSLANATNTGDISTIQLPVYLPSTPTGSVNVRIADFVCKNGTSACTGTGTANQYVEVRLGSGTGTNLGRYRSTATFAIPASAFTVNPSTGYYRAVLNLKLYNGSTGSTLSFYDDNIVSFRLYTSGSGPLIGGAVGGNTSYVNLSADNVGAGGPYSYSLPFATPCNITSSVPGTIVLYDMDNNDPDNDGYTVGISVINADTGAQVATTRSGNPGNQTDYNIRMNFQPNGRYKLVINNVAARNYIQYKFPFDDINYTLKCGSLYGLTPSITTNPTGTVKQGASINTIPSVASSGSPGNHDWKVASAVFAPGVAPQFNSTNDQYACNGFVNEQICDDNFNSGKTQFTTANTLLPQKSYPVASAIPVGSNICFVLSVNRPTATAPATEWRYSAMVCVRVTAPPDTSSVQIWGNDFYTGGQAVGEFRTPRGADDPTKSYGSWVEYGIFSKARNFSIASGAGLSGGGTLSQQDWSRLTFANTNPVAAPCSSGQYGCWGDVPDPSLLINALASRCSFGGDQTISTPKTVTGTEYICSNGTVRINANISYNDVTVNAPQSLPQLIIIANNIVIGKDVSNVDAWLVTKQIDSNGGNISTCDAIAGFQPFSSISPRLSESTCPTPLALNGPIITNHLYLYRTTKLTTSDNPAERLNLRADAYLWAYAGGGSGSPVAETVSVNELPPRF